MTNKRIRAKVGDVIEIPLPKGKKTYAQYVFHDNQNGDLVQTKIYLQDKDQKFDKDQFKHAQNLFRPLIISVKAAVKFHDWEIIDNIPIEEFEYPNFLHGSPGAWLLWTGEKYIDLGENIPDQYKDLEKLIGYSPDLIEKRIEDNFAIKSDSTDTLSTTQTSTQTPKTFLNTYMFYGDHAADYIYLLEDNPTTDQLKKTLQKVIETSSKDYLEAPEASEGLVAAEAVAFLKGKASPEMTDEFEETLENFKMSDINELNSLTNIAVKAVKRILSEQSELTELWKESKEYNQWRNAADNLIVRLS